MIYEEICTYEVCKLASEVGFKSFTRSYYIIGDKEPFFVGEAKNWNVHYDRYSAPTQSLLQKWLREEKRTHIAVFPNMANSFEFDYIVYTKGDKFWNPIYTAHSDFATYEYALEDALKHVLENLV